MSAITKNEDASQVLSAPSVLKAGSLHFPNSFSVNSTVAEEVELAWSAENVGGSLGTDVLNGFIINANLALAASSTIVLFDSNFPARDDTNDAIDASPIAGTGDTVIGAFWFEGENGTATEGLLSPVHWFSQLLS